MQQPTVKGNNLQFKTRDNVLYIFGIKLIATIKKMPILGTVVNNILYI